MHLLNKCNSVRVLFFQGLFQVGFFYPTYKENILPLALQGTGLGPIGRKLSNNLRR